MFIETQETLAKPVAKRHSGSCAVATESFVIMGITSAGRIFRPGDWAERLAGVVSTFDVNNRLGYSPDVHPTLLDGIKSIIVNKRLQQSNELAYEFLIGFGRDNDLMFIESMD